MVVVDVFQFHRSIAEQAECPQIFWASFNPHSRRRRQLSSLPEYIDDGRKGAAELFEKLEDSASLFSEL
jgi:hypothetical protein